MKKLLAAVLAFVVIGSGVAYAHQPVVLLNSDTTAAKGPLIVDGTVSYAVSASFTKAGQKKAFRAQFKSGDSLSVQYLIVNKKPESSLPAKSLPTLVITSPAGSSMTVKLNERTKFYEPFGKTNYLYLARYGAIAQSGVYSLSITSKGKANITVGIGDREVAGEVVRGVVATQTPTAMPMPTQSPTPMPMPTPTPTPTPTSTSAGLTMAQVQTNNTAKSCWAVVSGNVYNLTAWINNHPGGPGAILFLCGTDATSSFTGKHGNQSGPTAQLASYLMGPLTK